MMRRQATLRGERCSYVYGDETGIFLTQVHAQQQDGQRQAVQKCELHGAWQGEKSAGEAGEPLLAGLHARSRQAARRKGQLRTEGASDEGGEEVRRHGCGCEQTA